MHSVPHSVAHSTRLAGWLAGCKRVGCSEMSSRERKVLETYIAFHKAKSSILPPQPVPTSIAMPTAAVPTPTVLPDAAAVASGAAVASAAAVPGGVSFTYVPYCPGPYGAVPWSYGPLHYSVMPAHTHLAQPHPQ